MRECTTKAEGAKLVNLEPDTVYRWPEMVDTAISLMDAQIKNTTIEILAEAVAKAAMVKIGGMDSNDEKTRQDAASEVLDRVLGKATQGIELGGKGQDGTIIIDDKRAEYHSRALAALAETIGNLVAGQRDEQSGVVDASERSAMASSD